MLVGVKGISPFSFLALHQWKFSLVWLLRFDRLYSMLSDSPQQKSRRSITLSPRNKEKTPKEEISKQYIYMNFYKHRKIRLSRELRDYTGLNSCTICWTARNAENHLQPISLNLIKIHKTADYPFLFADLIFFWSPPFKTHITGCIYLSKSGVNMFWYKTRTFWIPKSFFMQN